MNTINLYKVFTADVKFIIQQKFTSMEEKYDVSCELSSYMYTELNKILY